MSNVVMLWELSPWTKEMMDRHPEEQRGVADRGINIKNSCVHRGVIVVR